MFHVQGVFIATFKMLVVLSIAYKHKYSHGICMKSGHLRSAFERHIDQHEDHVLTFFDIQNLSLNPYRTNVENRVSS